MPGLKLIHVCKQGPWHAIYMYIRLKLHGGPSCSKIPMDIMTGYSPALFQLQSFPPQFKND